MARIPEFTRQVVLERVQPSNIDSAFALGGGNAARKAKMDASSALRSAAQVDAFGDQYSKQLEASGQLRAHEIFNEFQRNKIGYLNEQKNQRMTTPDNFAKDMDNWFQQSQQGMELGKLGGENNQPFALDYFRKLMDQDRTQTLEQNSNWESGMRVKNVAVSTERNLDESNVNFALSNPRLSDLPKQLAKNRDYVNTVGKNVLDPRENQRLFAYGADKATIATMDSMLDQDPRTLKNVLYYGSGTKDQLIDMMIDDIEGGDKYVSDGDGFAKFGINSVANNMTPEQVKNLTRDDARKIYESKYWDKRFDGMDPAFRAVAFDAVVNHGNDKDTWKMIDEAKGDPYALIQSRQAEYARLVSANPEKYAKNAKSWKGRIEKITGYVQALDGGGREFLKHTELLDPGIIERTRNAIPGAIASQDRQAAAIQQQKLTVFNTQYKSLVSNMTNELEPIGQQELDDLKQAAVNSGDEEAIARADAMANTRTYVNSLKGLGEDQLRKQVRAASANVNKQPTPENRFVLDLTQTILDQQIKGIKDEGLAYYGRTNQIQMPQPLDYSQPEAVAKELSMRQSNANVIAGGTGKLLPVLTPDEVTQLKDQFENMPANQMAGLLQQFDGLDPRSKSTLAQSINEKSPIVATALSIEGADHRRRLLAGAKMEPKYKKEEMKAEVLKTLDDMVVDPNFKAQAVQSVSAYYNSLASEDRDFSDTIDSDRVEQSISALFGPMVEVSAGVTSKVFSFKDPATQKYVPEDDVYNMFNGINDEQLTALFGELPRGAYDEVIHAKDIHENARIVSAGDGIYNIVFDKIGGIYSANGKLLEIDGRKLLDLWRKGGKKKTSDGFGGNSLGIYG